MGSLKIGYIGVNSPVYYAKEYNVYENSIEGLNKYAQSYGFELVAYPTLIESVVDGEEAKRFFLNEKVEFLIVQNATFSMGDVIKVLASSGIKLGLWAISEPESEGDIKLHGLVAMNMYASIIKRELKDQKVSFKWFYGNADSQMFAQRFHSTVLALKAIHKLKTSKVCWVGNVAPTFDNMTPDLAKLKERFGITIEILPTDYIKEVSEELSEEELDEARGKYCKDVNNIHVTKEVMEVGLKVYCSLLKIAKEKGYDAMALACWPDFQDLFGIVPCVPFTELYDIDGIPVSCEGDLQGAITMMMLNEMTNNQSMLMDLTNVDLEEDMMLLWHCGIGSKSMAKMKDDISIIKHPMMNRKQGEACKVGASYDFYFKNTQVTIARIADNGESIFFINGDITDKNSKGYAGTRGWIDNLHFKERKITVPEILETIMNEGIEHHLIISAGSCGDAISEFCYWSETRLIEIDTYKDYL